jgi:hypothetical protein
MSGYLDQYGAGEERRGKIIKRTVLALVVLLVVGGALTFIFYNWREERQTRHFFALLQQHDYKGAYALWGCTDQKPCRDYSMTDFVKDWGSVSEGKITRSRSCGSGVIITVDLTGNRQERLWIQRGDLVMGFSPWQGCPAGK